MTASELQSLRGAREAHRLRLVARVERLRTLAAPSALRGTAKQAASSRAEMVGREAAHWAGTHRGMIALSLLGLLAWLFRAPLLRAARPIGDQIRDFVVERWRQLRPTFKEQEHG